MAIHWNTDVNATKNGNVVPCCPGEIVDGDTGQAVLIQTDWDYPGVAGSFGWYLGLVQRCPECGDFIPGLECPLNHDELIECSDCGHAFQPCRHDGTDGTVDCERCGMSAGDFISSAGDWLRENDGATAEEDPGYFPDND